jgi:phosphotransferase system  glucose/maltose/N-acetylglucosamine-specific IIC component
VIINVPLTFIPLLVGLIAFIHWASNARPPLPLWITILVVGGAVLFFVFSFLAFHRVVAERNEARKKPEKIEGGNESIE